ncbi:MAG: hypothetical protein ABW170_07930 [Candidatus Thiodiazotropha sp. L084R]
MGLSACLQYQAEMSVWWTQALSWVGVLTVAGIVAVIYASGNLAREAMLSLRIINLHFEELDGD